MPEHKSEILKVEHVLEVTIWFRFHLYYINFNWKLLIEVNKTASDSDNTG